MFTAPYYLVDHMFSYVPEYLDGSLN